MVRRIFDKWDLDSAVVGRVTDTKQVVVRDGPQEMARLPVELLADDAPNYDRPTARPPLEDAWTLPTLEDRDAEARLRALLGRPTIASKRWVFEQYDWSVRASTVFGPGHGDAAVLRLPDLDGRPQNSGHKGVAVTTDMNGRYVALDPYRGAALGVLEAARNLVCVGAAPKAATDCLNFGNPEKPEVMWTFVESIRGLADACRALETPIVSGNVSLYNETEGRPILPTPTIGMVGIVEDVRRSAGMSFRAAGDKIVLIGSTEAFSLGGSELVLMETEKLAGRPAAPDFLSANAVHRVVLEAFDAGVVRSAHDLAEGGFAVAMAESCFDGDRMFGARVDLPGHGDSTLRLFGEGPNAIVLSVAAQHVPKILALADKHEAPAVVIGEVSDRPVLEIRDHLTADLTTLIDAWSNGLRRAMGVT